MAFLDNSGDIILDAVLTDVGRKRMAQGNFRITKYDFGDDEIDYGLYNKNHPSGSAYYDLEILQTPILEAFVKKAAVIDFPLLSYTRTDLLYLPVVKRNQLVDSAVAVTGGMVQIAVNTETSNWIQTNTSGSTYNLIAAAASGIHFVGEIGLDTTQLVSTSANKSAYLVNTNLMDKLIEVEADNRFVNSVLGVKPSAYFRNATDGTEQVSLGPLAPSTATSLSPSLNNYNTFIVRTADNAVTYNTVASATNISVISGPRAVAFALNFDVKAELKTLSTGVRDSIWSRLGRTDVEQFGATNGKCDILDTTIYVHGSTTSATMQIPLRIMRYSGT